MKNTLNRLLATIMAAVLAGCAASNFRGQIDNKHEETSKEISAKVESIIKSNPPQLVKRSDQVWVGNKSIPLDTDLSLPPVFSKQVTMIFPGRINIRTVAERITKVTGLPVRLAPDVFLQQNIKGQGQAAPVALNDAKLPALPAVPGSGTPSQSMVYTVPNQSQDFEMNYTGSLTGLLNSVSSAFGLNWEFNQSENSIQFSKLVTKTFVLKANPGDSSFNASLGKSGGNGGSFTSDGQVKMAAVFSVWDGLEKALNAIRSESGKFVISQATGTIVYTDFKTNIDIAEKLIDSENKKLTRQVAIKLEMFSVNSNTSLEEGVDWNLVFTKFSQLAPQFSLNVVSPTSLTSAQAGGLGLSILAPLTSDSSAIQRLNGSDAFIRALKGAGRVNRMQTVSAMTLNRQPVPIGVTNQQSYLAKTTPGTSVSGGSSLPGLEPGQVTTGFLANFLPTILDNDSVLVQFSIDMSELQKIGVVSTGSGATMQAIQTPEVNGVQFVQRVALKAGSTLVLTGFERTRDNYDQRGLTESVGLGGSLTGAKTREAIVIMITPMIMNGA